MSALPRRGDPLRALARPGGLAALAITAFAALLSVQAADGPWLAELGRAIASSGSIPDGVPYATAVSDGWPNVPVLGELVFALLGAFGSRGVQVAQVAAVAGTLALLARDARRSGAQERALAIALLLLVPACFGPIVAIRAQLFSLPLFAACVLLLRSETREPSRRIWLLVPLLAVWGNLHGAVLTGAAVAGAYLVFERGRKRPGESIAVAAAGLVALCANPALWETPVVCAGRARERGRSPGDRAVGAAQPRQLARRRVRARRRGAARGRTALTSEALGARRNGGPRAPDGARRARRHVARAVRGAARRVRLRRPLHGRARAAPRTPLRARAARRRADRRRARSAAERRDRTADAAHARARRGTPVLAEDLLAEQVADRGGRVWVSNPIDAFRQADQRLYVAWLRGLPEGDAALAHAPRAVLVRLDGDADRRLRGDRDFRRVASDVRAVLYARVAR